MLWLDRVLNGSGIFTESLRRLNIGHRVSSIECHGIYIEPQDADPEISIFTPAVTSLRRHVALATCHCFLAGRGEAISESTESPDTKKHRSKPECGWELPWRRRWGPGGGTLTATTSYLLCRLRRRSRRPGRNVYSWVLQICHRNVFKFLDVTCLYVVRCTSRHPAPSGGTTASVGTCVELYYLREQRLYVCAPFVNRGLKRVSQYVGKSVWQDRAMPL